MKKLSYRALAAALLATMIICGPLNGKNPAQQEKVLTSEQQELQRRIQNYMVQLETLQKKAAKAFDAETDREKARDCKDARTTRDIETCLGKEAEITEANYSAFTGAIRELLSLTYPESSQQATSGPTGTPPSAEELVKEFDALQTA